MKLEHFVTSANFSSIKELERIELLAYYFCEIKGELEFDLINLSAILVSLGHAKPNTTRLKQNIIKSKAFIKGSTVGCYRLSVKKKQELKDAFPDMSKSEEIVSDDSVLPEVIFEASGRQYLHRLAKQINASYENNLFDGAAMLMRRLLEILLIHGFQKKSIESEVLESDGNYCKLKTLINKASSNKLMGLSPSTKKSIDQFRELGNLSAHRIQFNCRQDDIRTLKIEYRAICEELLYIADLVKK